MRRFPGNTSTRWNRRSKPGKKGIAPGPPSGMRAPCSCMARLSINPRWGSLVWAFPIKQKQMNERAKQYIKDNPDCTYDELVQNLGFKELSKAHFFSMKTLLRKKGLIPEESRTRRGRKAGDKNAASASGRTGASESSQLI